MSTDIVIRPFLPPDEAHVVQLWDVVFSDQRPWNKPSVVIRRKILANDGLFFVAESDNHIVATVMAGYDGVRGWIYSLAVAPELHRQGIGRRMMQHAGHRRPWKAIVQRIYASALQPD